MILQTLFQADIRMCLHCLWIEVVAKQSTVTNLLPVVLARLYSVTKPACQFSPVMQMFLRWLKRSNLATMHWKSCACWEIVFVVVCSSVVAWLNLSHFSSMESTFALQLMNKQPLYWVRQKAVFVLWSSIIRKVRPFFIKLTFYVYIEHLCHLTELNYSFIYSGKLYQL